MTSPAAPRGADNPMPSAAFAYPSLYPPVTEAFGFLPAISTNTLTASSYVIVFSGRNDPSEYPETSPVSYAAFMYAEYGFSGLTSLKYVSPFCPIFSVPAILSAVFTNSARVTALPGLKRLSASDSMNPSAVTNFISFEYVHSEMSESTTASSASDGSLHSNRIASARTIEFAAQCRITLFSPLLK